MTEQDLIDMGFNRKDVSPEESGCSTPFHYYEMEIGQVTLLSNANDETEDEEGWTVHLFDYDLWSTNPSVIADLVTTLNYMKHEDS